jgi:hypothetical protein
MSTFLKQKINRYFQTKIKPIRSKRYALILGLIFFFTIGIVAATNFFNRNYLRKISIKKFQFTAPNNNPVIFDSNKLSWVLDAVSDKDENIYLADLKQPGILKFNKSGEFMRFIGQRGVGPGDLLTPRSIMISGRNKNQCLYAFDNSTRLTHFDLSGNFKNVINIKEFFIQKFFYDEKKKNVYGFIREFDKNSMCKALVKFDQTGRKTIICTFQEEKFDIGKGGVVGGITHQYSPNVYLYPLSENEFLFADSMNYSIYIYDTRKESCEYEGEIIIKKDLKPRPLSESEKNYFEKLARKNRGCLDMPTHRPLIKRILCDDARNIFIVRQKSITEKAKKYLIDIYNAKGVWIGLAESEFDPILIQKKHLYTAAYDAEDEFILTKIPLKQFSENNNQPKAAKSFPSP